MVGASSLDEFVRDLHEAQSGDDGDAADQVRHQVTTQSRSRLRMRARLAGTGVTGTRKSSEQLAVRDRQGEEA